MPSGGPAASARPGQVAVRLLACLGALGLAAAPRPAAAQAAVPPTAAQEADGSILVPGAPEGDAWAEGPDRLFLAALAEAGTTQHLRGVAGWGRPWWAWAGLLADGWLSESFAIGTLGARAALRGVNLDVHWRATRYWSRMAMPAAPRHDGLSRGAGSTTHAWDVDLWGGLPLFGGFLLWEGQAARLLGVPRTLDVFDELVHGVVRAPWSGLLALGWVASMARGNLELGAGADVAFLGRSGAPRWRVGPQGSWTLSPRWAVVGQLMVPVAGPDHLPLWPSLGGGLVMQWRDATGPGRPGARVGPGP